jgi:hypothetical protein
VGVERDLAGIPYAKVPGRLLSADRTAEELTTYNAIVNIVTNLRNDEQAAIVWPNDRDEQGNPYYEFGLLTTGGSRLFDTGKIIERYDSRIAMAVMADFILLGHQQVGSYSLVSSKTNLFSTALGAWLGWQALPIVLLLSSLAGAIIEPSQRLATAAPFVSAKSASFQQSAFVGKARGIDAEWRNLEKLRRLPVHHGLRQRNRLFAHYERT